MRKKRKILVALTVTFLLITIFIWVLKGHFRGNEEQSVPILMYHKLIQDSKKADYYHLPVSQFERQLLWLKTKNYTAITLDKLVKAQKGNINLPDYPIILTFDDGTPDHYTYVYPLLKKYNFIGTFFIISGLIDKTLTKQEINEMCKEGMSIQSHTHTHPYLDMLPTNEIWRELLLSKSKIENITQEPVDFLAIPGGWYNDKVIDIAKKVGYKAILTSDIGKNPARSSAYILKRLDVPGTIKIDNFGKLFHPLNIFICESFRSIRLVVRKIIGIKNYNFIRNLYHKTYYKYFNFTLIINIFLIINVIIFVIFVIKNYISIKRKSISTTR